MGVHRGARIAAAGHGGQVLLSNTTRELVEDELPDDVRLRDLGEHELKDLKRPEHLFQLDIDGLPSEFPPLRTAQSSAFAGRERELTRAAQGVIRRRFTRRRTVLAGVVVAVVAAIAVSLALALAGSAEKAVAERAHATAIMYTPNVPPWLEEAQIVRSNLKPLGIDVEVNTSRSAILQSDQPAG
jgi:hypothetical protein